MEISPRNPRNPDRDAIVLTSTGESAAPRKPEFFESSLELNEIFARLSYRDSRDRRGRFRTRRGSNANCKRGRFSNFRGSLGDKVSNHAVDKYGMHLNFLCIFGPKYALVLYIFG